MATQKELLNAALEFAQRGWRVFRLRRKGKVPATINGFKDASVDQDEVRKMFDRKFNVGIATGPASGMWVLDLDGKEGIEAFDQLEKKHGKIETLEAQTGKGRHLYFALNGEPIKNRTRINGLSIDVRGSGGYVVAPPSEHESGRSYSWINKSEPREAPSWLVDLVLERDSSLVRNESSGLKFTIRGGLDLENDPGASKGDRHDRAKYLIGSELGKGTDPTEVARLAIDWARRCKPPADEDDILRLVGDLSRKEGVKIKAKETEIEDEPLPLAPDWPDLNPSAYFGLAGELVQMIEPETEADPAGILVGLLVSFGNLVGRSPHYLVEGTEHYPNLFAVQVGATSKGRKGTSEGRVRQVLRFVDEDWTLNRVTTGCVSGEGIVWNVRDPIFEEKPVKEKGKVKGYETIQTDPGVEDKRLFIIESEFGSVLRVIRRETNTLSPTLRSAWDTGDLRTLAKNSPAKATGAHISILGSITKEELDRCLAETENFSGFSNRFLWLLVRRSKLLPDGGSDLDLSSFAQRLSVAATTAQTITRMRRDRSATSLWHKAYADLSTGSGGLLGAVTSRGEAQVLRLSMVYALLDESATIREEHLRASLALWQYCHDSAGIIFGRSTGNPLADQVLDLIRTNPGSRRKDLHRNLGNHVKAKALVQALGEIRDAGLVRMETDKSTGGRPAERWFPAENKLQTNELSPCICNENGISNSELSELSPHSDGKTLVSSLVRNSTPEEKGEIRI